MSAVEAKTIGESAEQAEVDLTLDNISIVPDSLCMACGGSGETRIMLTKIPLFREVLLSSFACPHCGERNTEVQFGGETQPKGCRMAVTCSSREDLDRQVVKSESCKVLVPDLELEIPAATQRGVVTTVEGVLTRAADELATVTFGQFACRRGEFVVGDDHRAGAVLHGGAGDDLLDRAGADRA